MSSGDVPTIVPCAELVLAIRLKELRELMEEKTGHGKPDTDVAAQFLAEHNSGKTLVEECHLCHATLSLFREGVISVNGVCANGFGKEIGVSDAIKKASNRPEKYT